MPHKYIIYKGCQTNNVGAIVAIAVLNSIGQVIFRDGGKVAEFAELPT